MTTFDSAQHLISGDANEALSWIERSPLPEDQKTALSTFVNRFPSLTFIKEDAALLDNLAKVGNVTLPAWFRDIRCTLARTEPKVLLRVDDFDQYRSPRSDDVEEIWYDIGLGYSDDEQRELLHDKARVYPVGGWTGTDRSCLAIDLKDPSNTQLLEYSYEDLMDNDFDGRPVRGSLYPIFESYVQFFAHVVAVQLPDGTVIKAKK